METKKKKKLTHRNREQIGSHQRQGARSRGIGEGGQKVQTSNYKINKFWGCNVQHDNYN